MSKSKQHTIHLALSTILFMVIVVILFVAVKKEWDGFKEYDGGKVVLVTIESKSKISRLTYAVYGAYDDGGRRYTSVHMKNCTFKKVGEIVACKVKPGNPLYVCNAGVPVSPMMFLKALGLLVSSVLLAMTAYSLYRHTKMMSTGTLAIATVKSSVEKDGLFYGLVEFNDSDGNMFMTEICFEKRMVIRGQRYYIKYTIHEDGTVEAYYYDTKDL